MSVVDGEHQSANAIAIVDVDVLAVSADDFEKLLRTVARHRPQPVGCGGAPAAPSFGPPARAGHDRGHGPRVRPARRARGPAGANRLPGAC